MAKSSEAIEKPVIKPNITEVLDSKSMAKSSGNLNMPNANQFNQFNERSKQNGMSFI